MFTYWIAASGAVTAWGGVKHLQVGETFVGGGLVLLALLFGAGVLLILRRHPRTRSFWLALLSGFWLLGAAGLFVSVPDSVRAIQLGTLVVTALLIGYWARSNNVRATFRQPVHLSPLIAITPDA